MWSSPSIRADYSEVQSEDVHWLRISDVLPAICLRAFRTPLGPIRLLRQSAGNRRRSADAIAGSSFPADYHTWQFTPLASIVNDQTGWDERFFCGNQPDGRDRTAELRRQRGGSRLVAKQCQAALRFGFVSSGSVFSGNFSIGRITPRRRPPRPSLQSMPATASPEQSFFRPPELPFQITPDAQADALPRISTAAPKQGYAMGFATPALWHERKLDSPSWIVAGAACRARKASRARWAGPGGRRCQAG